MGSTLIPRPIQWGCVPEAQPREPWASSPRTDILGAASHGVLSSFSSQGDMGVLGPIGYPGPKGMKVNRRHPLIWVSSQVGVLGPISAEKERSPDTVMQGRGQDPQRGAGVEVGRLAAQFLGLRVCHQYVRYARHLYWTRVPELSMSLMWTSGHWKSSVGHHQGHGNCNGKLVSSVHP